MNNVIRLVTLIAVLAVFLFPGSITAQTADLQFVATINAGAGTGGLDQLEVDVQMNTDIKFDLGNSTIQFTYNDGALAVPSGAVGNDPLVESTDFDWAPGFVPGFVPPDLWYTSTATLFGSVDRPSLNITVIADLFGSTIEASAWTSISTFYFDITDGLQSAQLAWIPGTDPNPIVINTDDPLPVTNGTFTDNDADLDAGLPVELVNFNATVDNSDAVLTWTTASETGNTGFAVEYAETESGSWTELAFVESNGDTKRETGYTYRAAELGFGTFKFRLRQVDVSGSATYSGEVEVSIDVPNDFVLGAPYPNPFNPSAAFTLALKEQQEVRVELYNMLGQMIEVLHSGVLGANETHTFSIDGASLSSGMYLVRIAGENFSTTQTATLLK